MSERSVSVEEVDRFVEASRQLLERASVGAERGLALLSSPGDLASPLVLIREQAIAVATLSELGDLATAGELARFLLSVQTTESSWPEVVDVSGRVVRDLRPNDSTAVALWALTTYLRASGDEELAESVRRAAEGAAAWLASRYLNPYLYLVESRGSIHPPALSVGYDIWTSSAYAAAFAQTHRVFGGERFRRLALFIRRSVISLLLQDARFLRRLDPSGYPDPRPDMVMLAPYYFGLVGPSERYVMNTVDVLERALWHVELGGYARYLPYGAAERTLPPGPWPAFTAWMAQYHYEAGSKERAENVLRWLFDRMVGFELPQVVVSPSTLDRYASEVAESLYRADEYPLELAPALVRRLEDARDEAQSGEPVGFNRPCVWAHLETLRALKKGDYLKSFSARLEGPPHQVSDQAEPGRWSVKYEERSLGPEGHTEER